MSKNILLFLSLNMAACAMEPASEPKTPLYLVIGSTRASDIKNKFPHAQLWKENEADLTYKKAYHGKATTLDRNQCALPDYKHIVADPETYDFENHIIKAAYLEKIPTFKTSGSKKIEITQDYLSGLIQKIRPHMALGSKMKIEWRPSMGIYTPTRENMSSLYDEQYVKTSPFSGFVNMILMEAIAQKISGQQMSEETRTKLPKAFLDSVQSSSTIFKEIITFYATHGVGTEQDLTERIKRELYLWSELDGENKIVVLAHGPSASLEDFLRATNSALHMHKKPENFTPETRHALLENFTQRFNSKEFMGKELAVYDANDIFESSLFTCILSDAVVMHNTPYVKEFMENNGFKDVTIKRTKSKQNGRKNVWIIEGTSNESSA